jgi:glycosyltransferase involved in cell wall biosynthesis
MAGLAENNCAIFSVIMPVYNGGKYIDEAIQSVVNQTFINWELIIVDDGSTDSSLSIAKKWETKDSRIRTLQHPLATHKGVSASRNLGIHFAKSLWIALLDSDDMWLKENLEKVNGILIGNHDVILIYSLAGVINSELKTIVLENSLYSKSNIKGGKILDPFKKLIKGIAISSSSVVFKKSTYYLCGGFNEGLKFSEDTLFYHQIMQFGNIYFVDTVLTFRRLHNESTIFSTNKEQKIAARFTVYDALLEVSEPQNKKTVSKTLIEIGFKNIIRTYLFFPEHNWTLIRLHLKKILINKEISFYHKTLVIFMLIWEFILVPAKFIYFKKS